MSYTVGDLKADVTLYAKRDLTTLWPGVLKRSVARIGRDLRDNSNETSAVLTVGSFSGGAATTLPGDFAAIRQAYTAGPDGNPATLEGTGPAVNNLNSRSVDALGYTIFGNQIVIEGPPGSDVTIDYWRVPGPLVVDADTDPALDAHPELFLEAALMDLAVFAEDSEILGFHANIYNSEISRANSLANQNKMPAMGSLSIGYNNGAIPAVL